MLNQAMCVNALKGATFISTVAEIQHYYIFAEVFQNILKKAFLKAVFGKVTSVHICPLVSTLLVYLILPK